MVDTEITVVAKKALRLRFMTSDLIATRGMSLVTSRSPIKNNERSHGKLL